MIISPPGSYNEGKEVIHSWVSSFAGDVKTVLDIGVGCGTYAGIFRKMFPLLADAKWIGIEVWKPYIDEIPQLQEMYDQIINADMREFDYTQLGEIDLVFAGDVLEHVTKEEAQEVVKKLLAASRRVVISIPVAYFPQGESNDNPYEVHVKDDWSHEEVMSSFPNIKMHWCGPVIGVYYLER